MDGRHVARSSSQPGALSLYAPILRNKKAVSLGFLWLLGLYAVVLAPAPVKITEAKLAAFQAKLQEADGMMKGLAAAEKRLMDAEFRMKQVSVWFWRWRPEHRKRVEERMPAVEAAREKVTQLRRQRDGVLREAKQSLGLWSDAGIEEGRQLLWSSFSAGKVIAQRQTFWDTIFNILDGRDKDWVVLLIQTILTALINYTIGTLVSVFSFTLSLPSLLYSFAPSWPSAIAFFSVAVVASLSLVATYLALLYAAGGAVVMTTVAFVRNQRRIQGGSGGPEAIGRRSHYD